VSHSVFPFFFLPPPSPLDLTRRPGTRTGSPRYSEWASILQPLLRLSCLICYPLPTPQIGRPQKLGEGGEAENQQLLMVWWCMDHLWDTFLYKKKPTPNRTAITIGMGKMNVRTTIHMMPMLLAFENISASEDPTIRLQIKGKEIIYVLLISYC
jgi:hypothetical protein